MRQPVLFYAVKIGFNKMKWYSHYYIQKIWTNNYKEIKGDKYPATLLVIRLLPDETNGRFY
jgi:hypothetical protein